MKGPLLAWMQGHGGGSLEDMPCLRAWAGPGNRVVSCTWHPPHNLTGRGQPKVSIFLHLHVLSSA